MIVYLDTSALGSAYLGGEAAAGWISDVLLSGPDPVVTSELTDVELASLLARARRDGRIDTAGVRDRLDAYAAHTADPGPIGIAPVTRTTLVRAADFVLRAPVRTLDAIHLAAARLLAESGSEEIAILTRDVRQGQAAAALGFALHPRPAR